MKSIEQLNQQTIDALYSAIKKVDREVVRVKYTITDTDYDEATHKPCHEVVTVKETNEIKRTLPDVVKLKTLTELVIKLNEAMGNNKTPTDTTTQGVVILADVNNLEGSNNEKHYLEAPSSAGGFSIA